MSSDQPDYGPGETAVLIGVGFVPNEFVSVRVVHADGTPSTGADHDPWLVGSDESGRFLTTWHVCEDDCVNKPLLATADGLSSGLHAKTNFNDSHQCGTGVVTSVIGLGGSCVAFTPAVGAGPDNYEVAQGGTYVMTIDGVTECSDNAITVFIQSSGTGNFCFNATGGNGTYIGTFTMPNPACNTMPVSYKCGAGAACSHPGSFAASGPTSGCGGVHLRASTFDGSCTKTGDDSDCGGAPPSGSCCLADGSCAEVTAADCAAAGGTYGGDGSLCVDADCPPPTGSCCLVDGSCVDGLTHDECTLVGGTYNGDNTLCGDVSCPPAAGACCLEDGSCVQVTADECTAQGGTFQGEFTLCVNVDCPPPQGACCLDATTCVEVTAEECAELGGIYHGDLSLCSSVNCTDDFPPCTTFTFSTDFGGNPLAHGQRVDASYGGAPVLPVTITSYVHATGQATAAIFDSTNGPAATDPDLLVGRGNILILQNDANLTECPPASGIYCSHNDDEDGGRLSFGFGAPVSPSSIVLIDIDGDPTSYVILVDSNGLKRTYVVPAEWTGDQIEDGPPGWGTLDLTTLANQPGFLSTATASEQVGFNANAVIRIDVLLGGSGGVDDLTWCP